MQQHDDTTPTFQPIRKVRERDYHVMQRENQHKRDRLNLRRAARQEKSARRSMLANDRGRQ